MAVHRLDFAAGHIDWVLALVHLMVVRTFAQELIAAPVELVESVAAADK